MMESIETDQIQENEKPYCQREKEIYSSKYREREWKKWWPTTRKSSSQILLSLVLPSMNHMVLLFVLVKYFTIDINSSQTQIQFIQPVNWSNNVFASKFFFSLFLWILFLIFEISLEYLCVCKHVLIWEIYIYTKRCRRVVQLLNLNKNMTRL